MLLRGDKKRLDIVLLKHFIYILQCLIIDGIDFCDNDEERFIEWLIENDPDMIKNIMFDYLFDHATTIVIEE